MIESESTEESIFYIDRANKEIREEVDRGIESDTGVVIGSMDVEALYPSIQVNRSTRIVGEMVEESKLKIENVDYNTAVRYIASNSSQADIFKWGMKQIIPRRKCKTGVRPGATTDELHRRRRYNEEGEEIEGESKWVVARKDLSEKEMKSVVAKVIEIGVRTTFRNHVYQWGGQF